MQITVEKLTDVSLLRRAASVTTGKECKMTLARAYASGHSIIRTQIFWVECRDIPLFVASQLVRSHVGVQHFQSSRRPDRGAEDFRDALEKIEQDIMLHRKHDFEIAEGVNLLADRFDRYTPVDLAFLINAEALITMAHKRMCGKASPETRELVQAIRDKVWECDPDLATHMVPACVYRGGICTEPNTCGYNRTGAFSSHLNDYHHTLKAQ